MNETTSLQNIGAIISINLLVLADNHSTIRPDQNNEVDFESLNIVENIPFVFSQETAGLSGEKSETDNGDLFTIELNCMVPKIRPEVNQNMDLLKLKNFILLVKDGNSTQILIGNSQFPVKMVHNSIIPQKANGFNHTKVRFFSIQTNDILFLK
jgi:hypothetical protein